tara:strand:- start:3333 stop:4130 length:798 start_codon:yes stop_codon:yes gene_type:complete
MSKLQVDEIVNKEDTGSVSLPKGAVVTGVITATSFSGDGSALTGIDSTVLKDTGGNTKVQATSTGAVVTGIVTATSGSFSSVDISGNLSVGGTITKEDVTNVDSVGVITARSGINVPAGGLNIAAGISTVGGDAHFNKLLREKTEGYGGNLSSSPNVSLENGMVHYYTTSENTTATPNLQYNGSKSLNDSMNAYEAITVTLVITAASASGYYAGLNIDGVGQTVNWVGGSAPSSGGTSGLDIYTYTIIKTSSATYKIIGNHTKTS